MIEINGVKKSFGNITAVNRVTLKIQEKEIFGLIGTNGAGKSTLLRLLCGIYQPEEGSILIDGLPVYDNPKAKQNLFFIPDEAYFFPNSTAQDMADYYAGIYPAFDAGRFDSFLRDFSLDPARKISTFSKGMKKQLSLLLGVCAGTKYLLCDETFDGLDPVMRQAIKSVFASEMETRGLTPVITSHNLRELEDICDHVGLLHYGGVLLSEDLEDIKKNLQKVQVVFRDEASQAEAEASLHIQLHTHQGRLQTYTIRGTREEAESVIRKSDPVYYEILNLSLEEIFICETEVVGYDIKKFILG